MHNKKHFPKWLLALASCIILILALVVIWSTADNKDAPSPTTAASTTSPTKEPTTNEETVITQIDPIPLQSGLSITHMGSYTGVYMEDYTDETVSNVMMIILKNDGQQDLQLARISINYADFTAEFEVTNLAVGQSAVLLEKNRHSYVDEKYSTIDTYNVVHFPEPMSLQEESLTLVGGENYIELTNISGTDLSGPIYIYYKNGTGDLFNGGITYRVPVAEGLAAGETQRVLTGHFSVDSSTIVWVTIGTN